MSTSQLSRRTFTQRSILGLVGVGLMTAATGIPPWFLGSRRATARPRQDEVEPERAQLLILSTSAAGDPVNANAPGTYGFPDIIRSADPSMAETAIQLGNVQTTAARVWSTLPQWVLDRTAFIHHSTPTQIHPDHPKVLALWEKTPDKEAFPTVFTRYLGPALGTVISTPVSAGAGPVLKVRGRTIADQSPLLLRDLLAQPQGPLTTLATPTRRNPRQDARRAQSQRYTRSTALFGRHRHFEKPGPQSLRRRLGHLGRDREQRQYRAVARRRSPPQTQVVVSRRHQSSLRA